MSEAVRRTKVDSNRLVKIQPVNKKFGANCRYGFRG
jgi:hypothetical protein